MSVKVALILIVKNSEDEGLHLYSCLENVAPHVDGIFLNINRKPGTKTLFKLKKIAKEFNAEIIETEWSPLVTSREEWAAIKHDLLPEYRTNYGKWKALVEKHPTFSFGEIRNQNLAQVPEDYTHIIWLDTDDTIDNPVKIRQVAEKAENFDALFVDYLYDHDDEGNVTTAHLVARLFKNNGSHQWKGRIHETLIENRSIRQGATKDFNVIHHADDARSARSFDRNIKILEMQLQDEKEEPDPRTICYLARAYYDSGQHDRALPLYEMYLDLSGWDQERATACTRMGLIYLERGDRTGAKRYLMQAIGEDPDDPLPRIEMGSLELEINQYNKARRWLEPIEAMEKNLTTLERNPLSYTFRTYLLLADVYLGLGGSYLDKALEYAKKALKYKKKDTNIREYVKIIESVVQDKHLTEKVLDIVKVLKKNKEEDKIKSLANSLPRQLDDNPVILQLRNEGQPFKWPDKSVAIMCGNGVLEEWGPWSLEEGIGGSEEAVIRLSSHLHKLGYQVVVYGNPSARSGEYDGVMWRNSWEANPEDEFDILIGWRYAGLFDTPFIARKKYLWLHDVVEPGEFTKERLESLDKVIVLSKYHRSLFPMIPDEKILMSGNGIDPVDFEAYDGLIERDPHKIFYGSALERGLVLLCEIWPDVRKAVPDATLDIYYGRGSYDAVNAGNPERLKWMDDLLLKVKSLDGMVYRGKVSQTEIVKAAFQSGVWAYPSPFPEIYCITAVKCQAAGAIPVTSNFAALDQMVQFGTKIPMNGKNGLGIADETFMDNFKEALIETLKHPEGQETLRRKMEKWARTNSWEKISKEWNNEFRL